MNDIDFKTLQHQIELFTFELRRLQDLHIKETGVKHFVTGFERMTLGQIREEYSYTADAATLEEPGCPAEVDFTRIEVNGSPAGDDLEELLFEQLRDRVKGEIISKRTPGVDAFDCLRIREAG